jgi:hypothetical protein
MRLIKGLITAAIAMALFAMPAAALAKRGDRNHDRIPDKWEKRHHLSTRANVARRDPDKDGLNTLGEFRHGTDPRDADTDDDQVKDGNEVDDHTNPRRDDSDDDGVDDGDEVSGTIVSFTNGVLTIQLAREGAGTVSGTVNDATRIECDDANDDAPTATASHDGDGEDSGSGDDDGDNSGPGSTSSGPGDGTQTTTTTSGSDDGANHDADDDDNEHACTSANLTPGTRVHEAKTATAADGSTVFTKIELVPAA